MLGISNSVPFFRLLGNLPNTYAYSKNLTEQLVTNYSSKFPIAIARPSIGKKTLLSFMGRAQASRMESYPSETHAHHNFAYIIVFDAHLLQIETH
jgi:nucleoside-diphosphate-sugar epimerase